MKRRAAWLLAILLVSPAGGCSRDRLQLPAAPETPLAVAPGTMVARVNGKVWLSEAAEAFWLGPLSFETLNVSGSGAGNDANLMILLSFSTRVAAVGSYAFGGASSHYATVIEVTPGGPGAVYRTDETHTGSATITEVDDRHIVGEFRFDAATIGGETLRMTSGGFDAPFDSEFVAPVPLSAFGSARSRAR